MNPVLERILNTRKVRVGDREVELGSEIPKGEGQFLWDLITSNRPARTLEIGCAFGVSSLFICDALSRVSDHFRHIIIDPFQHRDWHGAGVKSLEEAGFSDHIELIEKGSEIALPRLLGQGERFDFAFIDGWHTFDHALVDFFYINKLIDVDGIIVFDDARWKSVRRVVRHALTYPCYRLEAYWPMSFWTMFRFNRIRHVRCVAIRKVVEDDREQHWYADF